MIPIRIYTALWEISRGLKDRSYYLILFNLQSNEFVNPYLVQIEKVLPRILALFDTNLASFSRGIGDRYRWAWKLIDFGNGTFQGAAHGLARLMTAGLLPLYLNPESVRQRIDALFEATPRLTRPNGSLEEAFPFESSFCLTALVAYDLLSAIEQLRDQLDPGRRERYLAIVKPMIHFLHQADETHAFISNHLATATCALFKWHSLTGETGEIRGQMFLERILRKQSDEGWFLEYEGTDPGYETLCLYYLSDLHRLRPDLNLQEALARSIRFLWHFAHPDGSFGGLYGSRNTRFYYPAGLEVLAGRVPEAAALAGFMQRSIGQRRVVTLETMDEPNLIPMFNAYCLAAAQVAQSPEKAPSGLPPVPSQCQEPFRKVFPDAGLMVDKGEFHYTILSLFKGGVVYHFRAPGHRVRVNSGVLIRNRRGDLYSTQGFHSGIRVLQQGDRYEIRASFTRVSNQLPTPFQFLLLRVACLTLMRFRLPRELVKKFLVKLLITGKNQIDLTNTRVITLGQDLQVADRQEGEMSGFERLPADSSFSAIHMASQGYWQTQDDH